MKKLIKLFIFGLAAFITVSLFSLESYAKPLSSNEASDFSFVSATGIDEEYLKGFDYKTFSKVVGDYSISRLSNNELSIEIYSTKVYYNHINNYQSIYGCSLYPVYGDSESYEDCGNCYDYYDRTGMGSSDGWCYAISNGDETVYSYKTSLNGSKQILKFTNNLKPIMNIYVPICFEDGTYDEYDNVSYEYGILKFNFSVYDGEYVDFTEYFNFTLLSDSYGKFSDINSLGTFIYNKKTQNLSISLFERTYVSSLRTIKTGICGDDIAKPSNGVLNDYSDISSNAYMKICPTQATSKYLNSGVNFYKLEANVNISNVGIDSTAFYIEIPISIEYSILGYKIVEIRTLRYIAYNKITEYIYNQDPIDFLKFGDYNVADNGCSTIAIHNALLLAGYENDYLDILDYYNGEGRKYIKPNYTINQYLKLKGADWGPLKALINSGSKEVLKKWGLDGDGGIGLVGDSVDKYLDRVGASYQYFTNLDNLKAKVTADSVIILEVFNGDYVWDGGHFYAFKLNGSVDESNGYYNLKASTYTYNYYTWISDHWVSSDFESKVSVATSINGYLTGTCKILAALQLKSMLGNIVEETITRSETHFMCGWIVE